eukprot:CAMPEP_0185598180 /NCGR_PEP_ID=MMETSP0434-20130131/81839_1 /TAXON_ID=626734 ORGANISM="Favella taraikaensis, Strain Fe Narragansett Bay" /NCGR_SAMPLE_ID=MMETSP0434 /ASSEMBLY_ACC=CAM_ASM_000379 /LENGTH=82 /DNA_ID=CAMNT_0028227107 /DNA_START=711 /DNA_END=956 /DNA_ORIENTATION=-
MGERAAWLRPVPLVLSILEWRERAGGPRNIGLRFMKVCLLTESEKALCFLLEVSSICFDGLIGMIFEKLLVPVPGDDDEVPW